MLAVLVIMSAGIVLGFFVRKRDRLIRIVDSLIMWAIYALLFLLGISVGVNEEIVSRIGEIGLQAIVITFAALLGSCVVAHLTYVKFFREEVNEE